MQIYGRLLVGDVRQNRISTIGHYKQGLIYNCFKFMSIGWDLGQKINWIDQFRLLLDFTRAKTESIHFDSPKWIENQQRFRFARRMKFFFDLWFTLASHFIFDSDSFWFSIQFDFIHFDSVWFWFVKNYDSPANHDSPANQKSNRIKIKGRWIVIHSFPKITPFESKAIKGNREISWSEPWTSQGNVFTRQINSEIYQSNFKFWSCLEDPKVLDPDSCHDFIWCIFKQ